MNPEELTFFSSKDTGQGLPFAIVDHTTLMQSDDIFVPSLRDFHVLFWFKKGGGKYYVDFKEYEFEPDTLLLLSKDQLQYFEEFDRNSCEIQSIAFVPDFIYRNDNDIRHLFQFNMGSPLVGVQVLNIGQREKLLLEQFSDQMKMIFREWEGETREVGFYHALCLFLTVCERLQDPLLNAQEEFDEDSKMLWRFTRFLEKHFRTEFKVDFYTEKLQIHPKLLARLTREKFRLSPKAVIDQRRMLEIKRQLRGSSKPAKTIAYELGFGEPTNLFKYFRKHTGMTPQEFRISN
ncbi:helix-turn-helix transcriptional regulator [bacterium SCSIO 12741]|nr:helix-turn-helix transcriptional regulator [bacterium SCSIO 12741]